MQIIAQSRFKSMMIYELEAQNMLFILAKVSKLKLDLSLYRFAPKTSRYRQIPTSKRLAA